MFLRIVRARGRKGQQHEYLRLVESYWANGRSRQRVVMNLGRKDWLSPHLDDLIRLLQEPDREDRRGGTERAPSPAAAGPTPLSAADNKNDVLRKLPVFSDLSKERLAELSQVAAERCLKRGQFLFREGDPVVYLYVVVTGMVKILKHSPAGKDFIIAFCGSGEMLGDVTLFSDKPHPSGAQAVVDTRVLVVKNDDFLSFLRAHPDLSLRILGKMLNVAATWLFDNAVRLMGLAAETADRRLAYVLFALSLKFGLTLPFTRQEIAEMAGTTTETAIRFMNRLKQTGAVSLGRGKVTVLEQDRLERLAEGYLPG